MKTRSKPIPFDRLNDAEKEKIYRQCERIRPEQGRRLNATDRRRHRAAGLSVGRPRVGRGAKRINISMEQGLLKIADAFAQKRGITRARLIADSIRAYLAGAA